jgi:ABC-type lipoprotein export system ATPase subunit
MSVAQPKRTDTILEAVAVSKTLPGSEQHVTALQQVNLSIARGEFVAITGPSGSGKSTLLYLLGALDRPSAGQILIDGVDTRLLDDNQLSSLRNRMVGFVFQFHFLLPDLSALDNVALPMLVRGLAPQQARQRAAELLDTLGVSNRATHRPHQLSGGQQQRVAIARGLANQPDVLLGDELTGNLDTRTGEQVIAWLLANHRRSGQTVILVTHNPDIASQAQKVIQIVDGRVL